MQKSIEKVCNIQIEFWQHLNQVVPDLNILNDLGRKIYEESQIVDDFWRKLCDINPSYHQALSIYGDYLKQIRNHESLGNTFINKAYDIQNA